MSNQPTSHDPNAFLTLGDVVEIAKKKKWIVLGSVAVFSLLAGAYTFRKKPVYESKASIILPVEAMPGAGGGLGALVGIGQGPSIYSVLVGLVDSATSREVIGKKAGILAGEVKDWLRVEDIDNLSQITFVGKGRSPEGAQKLVQSALDQLEVMNQELRIDRAGRQADSVKSKLDASMKELKEAEDDLVKYQQENRTAIDPRNLTSLGDIQKEREKAKFELEQAKAQLESIQKTASETFAASSAEMPKGGYENMTLVGDLRKKLVFLQAAKSEQERRLGPKAPELLRTRLELDVVQKALYTEQQRLRSSIQNGSSPEAIQARSKLALAENTYKSLEKLAAVAPTQFAEIRRRFTKVESLGAVVAQLTQRYQEQRVSADVKRITWSVLDAPSLQTKPINKQYTREVPLGALAGLVFGLAIALRQARKK